MLSALGYTIFYAVFTTILVTVAAIPLALTLNRKFLGRNLVRSAFFFPAVPSVAILGLVWGFILNPLGSGVLNSIIHSLTGLGPIPWLSNSTLAQLSTVAVTIWALTGWHAVLYLAYLQAIPADYYEVSKIDGASSWQSFRYITLPLPLLVPAMAVSQLLLMTNGLKVFDLPFYAHSRRSRLFHQNSDPIPDRGRHCPTTRRGRVSPGCPLPSRRRPCRAGPDGAHERPAKEILMTKSRHTLRSVLMILLAAVMSVPFYYIVVNTFKTQQETTNSPLALPTHWVFDNYIKVFEGTPVVPSLMNTVYVMAISIFLTLAIGSLAAFGQITGRSRISQIIGAVLVAAFIIPELQLRAAYRLPAG